MVTFVEKLQDLSKKSILNHVCLNMSEIVMNFLLLFRQIFDIIFNIVTILAKSQ